MRGDAKLALFALPVFVVAAFLLARCSPRGRVPEALDPDRSNPAPGARPSPEVRLEQPPALSRKSEEGSNPTFPFNLADANRLRLESSKGFEFERIWVKTATEPRWVARALVNGQHLPYVESELPLAMRAPGHREYPLKRAGDFALLPVDAYTLVDLSRLGQRFCVASGFELDLSDAHTSPPYPERFIHRIDGDFVHIALSRNPAHINPRSRLRSEFGLTTSCDWRLDLTWEPLPETSSVLDVASRLPVHEPTHTSATVRLSAPFDFDPGEFELSYASHDRRSAVASQAPRDFDIQRLRLPEWGEIRWVRESEPRRLVRNGNSWTLNRLTLGQQGVLVAGHVAGESMGRWLGQITPDLDVEIRLERGVFLSGRLIHGGTGRPLRGAELDLSYTDRKATIRHVWGSRPEAWARSITIHADAHGRFRTPSTSPPAVDYAAPSRPSPEFWATFSAPFFEPSVVHHTDSSREIDLGEIVLTPKTPDISFVTSARARVPVGTLVLLKREGTADPKLCRVLESRLRKNRMDLDIGAHSMSRGSIHQQGPDRPGLPLERGLVFNSIQPHAFQRLSDSEDYEDVGTRELEIEVSLPMTRDPKFSVNLSYEWDGLLVHTAQFNVADTNERNVLRRTIPDEDVEFFLHSKEGKKEQRVAVPRDSQRISLSL